MAKAASKSKAPEKKPAPKKGATKPGTTAKSRRPKKQDPVAEHPEVIEQVPVVTLPVQVPVETIPVAEHEEAIEKKDNLLVRAKENIEALEGSLDSWKRFATEKEEEIKELNARLDSYLQPINNDVQVVKKEAAALPAFWKWVMGIVIFGLVAFAAIRAYRNAKDETSHKTTQAEVKILEKQRDSLIEDWKYYKRIAAEQASQTDFYKKKVLELTGQIEIDNTQSDKERQNDKTKINETKNAIRHAASDSQLIGVLTNTLRQ